MTKSTKSATIQALLARPKGATIETLCAKTGWQAHSVHAFLSRLRKGGAVLERASTSKGTSYRLLKTDSAE